MTPIEIIREQRINLDMLQAIVPNKPIEMKILPPLGKGETYPEGVDRDCYNWRDYKMRWNLVTVPIFTRSILPCEIVLDPDTNTWADMKTEFDKLMVKLDALNIPYHLAYSGGKGCHIHIVFNVSISEDIIQKAKSEDFDINKCVRMYLFQYLVEQSKIDTKKIVIDMPKISFCQNSTGGRGSQIRAFGTLRANGFCKTLITAIPDKQPETPLPLVFPKDIPIWQVPGFHNDVIIQRIEEGIEKQQHNYNSQIPTELKGIDSLEKIPCVLKMLPGREKGRHYGSNAITLAGKLLGFTWEKTEPIVLSYLRGCNCFDNSEIESRRKKSKVIYESDKKLSCGYVKDNLECPSPHGCIVTQKRKEAKIKRVYHWSDLGNAQRLKDEHGDNIRYCHPYKSWLVWDGKRWASDRSATVRIYARKIVQGMYDEISRFQDSDDKKNFLKFVLKTESANGISNMLKLAESEPGIPILPESFDTDPMLFNIQNGTIDLRTGKFKEHNQDDCITKISPVVYDPNATCPTWLLFLDKIFAENKDLIEYEQRKSGYRTTGLTKEEDFDINYGTGGNGKSKFFDEIVYIMGEYHKKINVETIQEISNRDGNSATSDVACLKGVRFVTVSEPKKGMKLDEGRIKDWTGRDVITARHLYSEQFDFYPQFKIDLYTNHKPIIKSQGRDMWRRIKLVPFNVTITDEEKDVDIGEKLKKESSGILNWMIKGCLKWQQDGLKVPDDILQATQEYKEDLDYLGDFFNECCEIGKDKEGKVYKAPFKWLHLVYRAYCSTMDMPAQSHVTFAGTLIERNFKREKTAKGYIYNGIRLKVNIEEQCHNINTMPGGFKDAGMHIMQGFLETFLNKFSYDDFSEKPAKPAQPAQKDRKLDENQTYLTNIMREQIERKGKEWQDLKQKSINSSTISEFCDWYYEQHKDNDPSEIAEIARRIYGIPEDKKKEKEFFTGILGERLELVREDEAQEEEKEPLFPGKGEKYIAVTGEELELVRL